MNALCFHRRDISVCMISRYDITLNVLEQSSNVKELHSGMTREFTRHKFHRERLEFNEE